MATTRKKFSAEFKAKVVMAALGNQMSISEIISKYGVSKTMVYKWKEEVAQNMPSLFGSKPKGDTSEKRIDELNRKIGELTMELDFAKRASRALGIEMPARN